MSPHRAAAAPPPGSPHAGALPLLTLLLSALLPLLLLLLALGAALLASRQAWAGMLNALALLLVFAGAMAGGVGWARLQQQGRLQQALEGQQLLGQLIDLWTWQTDAAHQLRRLQAPQGAAAPAWVAEALQGQPLWQAFDDAAHSLQARLQAEAPLGELRVLQATRAGQPAPTWVLRGLPRFDANGQFAGYLGVAWPTARADAQHTAQQGFEALFDQGPAAQCLALPAADAEAWVLVRANPAALALLDQPALAPGGLPWADALARLPPPLRGRVAGLQPGQHADGDGWQVRLAALAGPAPQARPALLLSLQALDPAVLGSAPPSSHQAAHQAAIDAALQAAHAAASAAAAAEQAAFSYTISHDLRAPIRVVEGFGRILKEDYAASLDRVGRDHLDRVMAAAARMNHMIDALLSLSRLSTQPLAHQPVNLSQLARFVIDDLQRGAPERAVTVLIAPDLVAEGDPTLLRTVLENLLGNAWKYSAKVAQAQIGFGRVQQAGRTVYQVTDNGAGFDMRFADRLFGVFQRLHSSSDFQGHGVGLASVKRIVRRHGGEIWADGEVGVGATFSFTLAA